MTQLEELVMAYLKVCNDRYLSEDSFTFGGCVTLSI